MDDPFYSALKQRVAATLAKQGIDPEKQRVAPPQRVAYYALIATCLIASGYGHIKVRLFLSLRISCRHHVFFFQHVRLMYIVRGALFARFYLASLDGSSVPSATMLDTLQRRDLH